MVEGWGEGGAGEVAEKNACKCQVKFKQLKGHSKWERHYREQTGLSLDFSTPFKISSIPSPYIIYCIHLMSFDLWPEIALSQLRSTTTRTHGFHRS